MPGRLKQRLAVLAWHLERIVIAVPAPLILVPLAFVERVRTSRRQRRGERPRLIWGPTPIINIKFWAEAMREAGYPALTCVTHHYPSNRREDFDVYRDQFGGEGRLAEALRDYRFFAWTLRNGDVFMRNFDGGCLRETPLRFFEAPLMKLAGKRIVVSPFGSDVAVDGHLGGLEPELYAEYPALEGASDKVARWVRHTTRWADLIIRNWQLGYIPSHDVVWVSQLAIDLPPASDGDSGNDGRSGPVTVLHAPNHRRLKGTAHLERAVEELRGEGLAIELILLEGQSNKEVRARILKSDVVADQFLLSGYAMLALEGMAAGRPVMANIGALPEELRETDAIREAPVVDTGPNHVAENLRRLVTDPDLRAELGRRSREFVERHHSFAAIARDWEAIVAHVWTGEPLPRRLLPGGIDAER